MEMSSDTTIVKSQMMERSQTFTRGAITGSKTVVINRTQRGFGGSQWDFAVSPKSICHSSSWFAQMSGDVSSTLKGRKKEKKEMQELNGRLVSYIEKVRFLEAQNKRLSSELQQLKDIWGKETEKVKQTYGSELTQLRKLLGDSDKHKAEYEVRISSLEDQLNELQVLLDEANRINQVDHQAIEKLNRQMADYDGEISLLRRRVANFDEERSRDQREIKRLRDEVNRLRTDLDAETLNHINFENEAQSLREELEFIKQIHESQIRELAALAYRDTTTENRNFWKNEMSQALHDIQQEYDLKLDTIKNEIESQYSLKFQEVRTNNTRDNMELSHLKEENKRIKFQMTDARNRIPELEARNAQLEREMIDLKHEMEEAQREYDMVKGQLNADLSGCRITLEKFTQEQQVLTDKKLSLEMEILAYRKLLEGEEIRTDHQRISKEASFMKVSIIENKSVQLESTNNQQSAIIFESMQQQSSSVSGHSESVSCTVRTMESMEQHSVPVPSPPAAAHKQILGHNESASRIVTTTVESMEQHSVPVPSPPAAAHKQMIIKGEMSAKTTSQRTSKGNVAIQECSPDGKLIIVENTGKQKEDISGWKISRNINNGSKFVNFTFPTGLFLDNGQHKTVKIWAKGSKPLDSSDLEIAEFSWGLGANIITSLLNAKGEERATHTQKTTHELS